MNNVDYSRRCDRSKMTAEELIISDAMRAIEDLPAADVRLTDVVTLLQAAKNRLADYVDNIDGIRLVPYELRE